MPLDLKGSIEEFLQTNPGWHSAKDISGAISADKKEVNRTLYKHKGKLFSRSASFEWGLMIAQPASAGAPPSGGHLVLARLAKYYLACLARDRSERVSEWARSKFGKPEYVELDALPAVAEDPSIVWESADVGGLLAKLRSDKSRLTLYVGYPTRLFRIRGKKGGEFWKIEPVILFEYRLSESGGPPELTDERPIVNQQAVENITGARGPDITEEVASLSTDVGLDSLGADPDDIAAALSNMASIRPDWPWVEPLDPDDTSSQIPLSELAEDGIYNRAVALLAEKSPFTVGLEAELRELEGTPANEVSRSALGFLLDGKSSPPSPQPVAHDSLVEVVSLNLEQREAVERALSEPLTVITGPPGTGKSQVVAAIVANCVWRGQSVLVASKNNKAVDVVQTRVNALHPRPVILRVGTSQISADLAQHLASILSGTCTASDKQQFDEAKASYDRLLAVRKAKDEELLPLVDLRNRVDLLEQQVEELRGKYGAEVFRCMADRLTAEERRLVGSARLITRAACRTEQGLLLRLLWPIVAAGRLKAADEALSRLTPICQRLGLTPVPQVSAHPSGDAASKFIDLLSERIADADRVSTYWNHLRELSAHESLEEIARERSEILKCLAEAALGLWRAWLTLQPSRLNVEHRRLLGDYKSLVEMLADSDKTAGSLRRKALELFPRLVSVLPAWGVTSLSVRNRIPFGAGFFDLLIIDEASQCDIASALPLLFRARRVVVIGDPMQLQHITQIAAQTEQSLLVEHGVIDNPGASWAYSGSSLYNLAASISTGDGIVSLRDHHRSHPAIIGFSNQYFYEGRLRVATRQSRLHPRPQGEPAVRWISVTGKVERPAGGGARNDEEARRVVAELERLLVVGGFRGSVGVVTPFRAQANRINDLVSANEHLEERRVTSGLLIDVVHSFQGDERDVMVFSPVVSTGMTPGGMNFLRKTPNLFNVAVTRARSMLIAVGDAAACSTCGVGYLEAFAAYAKNPHADPTVDILQAPDNGPNFPTVADPSCVSDWERLLYSLLFQAGIRPIPQYPVEQYRLDFAIARDGRRLDIEVDGEHHRSWTGELCYRDQLRNQRLLELGWDVMRFWVYQIRDTPEWCVERVLAWLNPSDAKPDSAR